MQKVVKSLCKGERFRESFLFFFYLAALKNFLWNTASLFLLLDYRDCLN